MEADYFRYLTEFILEDNLPDLIDKAENAYKKARAEAEGNLPVTHPLRLGVMLNYAVFTYDIK